MNLDLSPDAEEYGRVVQRALDGAGGDELVRRAEADPKRREELVAPLLGELGVWDLDPRSGPDELEAAAAVCRAAGWWALAYPVAARLARPADADALVVVSEVGPAAAVDGLDLRLVAVTVDGARSTAAPRPSTAAPRYSAFVTDLDLAPAAGDPAVGTADAALGLVLSAWTLLGMLDRAMVMTRTYVMQREQFGQLLGRFQGVQFQLTDAEVERAGVAELARYALWSVQTGSGEALADALALRLAAVEAAEIVFRITHQLHGAIGFCDETTLSWVSRYSQPLRRLPWGPSGTRDALTRQVGRRGLAGIYGEASAR